MPAFSIESPVALEGPLGGKGDPGGVAPPELQELRVDALNPKP